MVQVFDNVLSPGDQKMVLDYLQQPGWAWGAYSDADPDAPRYWYKHFAGHAKDGEAHDLAGVLASLDAYPPIRRLWTALNQSILAGHQLMRCYANAYPAGTEGSLHRDSLEPGHFTAIYYPHLAWTPNYAGETVFFNDAGNEIVASVYPRPNRLALFSGSIPHVARGVSRQCPNLRITLMFKTAAQVELAKKS